LAKKEKHHIIDHQIINLEIEGVEDPAEINQIQQNILYFYKERIGAELEKLLNDISSPGVDIQIDHIEIDLEDINYTTPAELEKLIIAKFKKAAEKEIKAKIKKIQKTVEASKGRKKKFSKAAILVFFLKNGYYPSWAGPKNGTVSEIFEELIKKRAKDLATRIFRMGKDKKVQERLYQQFSVDQLELLFEELYGSKAVVAYKQMRIIQKRLGAKSEKAIVSAAINYILEKGAIAKEGYTDKAFSRNVIEDVQKRKIPTDNKTKVRAGFEGKYKDIQILEYFLEHGAIPSWGDVDSDKSFQELFKKLLEQELVNLQRMVERHAKNSRFTQRLIFQFSTKDVLRLLEPTSGENLRFIEDSLSDFEFLSTTRQNITKKISKTQIRTVVLTEALDYFFLHKKTKFVKKSFVTSVIKELSDLSQTSYDVVVKESYKSVRRKKTKTALQPTLELLDGNLKQKMADDRTELREKKKEYREIQRTLDKLKKKQEKGTLSSADLSQLKKTSKKFKDLEQKIEELGDEDMPLEIELLVKQQQELKEQLKVTKDKEFKKIEKRLENSEKEFLKLQTVLTKEIQSLIKDKAKLKDQVGTITEKRIKRVNSRLGKYHRAVKNIVTQLKLDQQDVTLFLGNINRALRERITPEEKSSLRKERARLQKELIKINEYLEQLVEEESKLEEALKSAMAAVDGEDDALAASNTSKLDALIFMLKYGASPWWAEKFPKQSIEELFMEFAADSPQKLLVAFQNIGKYPVVWERVVNQLSEKAIKTVVSKLYPTSATKVIFAEADLLFTLHYSQGFKNLKSVDRKKFQWSNILEYIFGKTQTFNPQNFYREVTLETARVNNLSPSKFIEYSNNIIQNRGGSLDSFIPWNKALAKDRRVSDLDKEILAFRRQQEQKKQGLYLSDAQKLELLVGFLSTGKISDAAKKLKYDNFDSLQNLLLEQIQRNRANTKDVVVKLMRLSNARALIVKELSEDTFWEIIHLVRPQALLPIKRHFIDFRRALKDKNLYQEKDVLLNFLLSQQQGNFEISGYLMALIHTARQKTGRQPIALILDWKRRLIQLGNTTKSSWLLSVLMLEVEFLKEEQKQSTDVENRKMLQQQLESLAQEYTTTSGEMMAVLSEETAEAQGIPSKDYKLREIDMLIEKLYEELEKIKETLSKADALKAIEDKRKIVKIEAQLKILKQRRPPLVRKLEQKIKLLKEDLIELDEELQEEAKKAGKLEVLAKEESFLLSLMERQSEMLVLLEVESERAIKELPQLLVDLSDTNQSNYLYFKELEKVAQELKTVRYKTNILGILNKVMPSVVSLDDLKASISLDEQQQELLEKIDKTSPFQLWKEWEALEVYYKEHPNLYTKEKEQLQKQIYKEIDRRDKKNLLTYTRTLQKAQEVLEKELDDASSKEVLDTLQEQLVKLREQQQKQVDEMLGLARDEKSSKDFARLRENIDHVFARLENKRKRYSYSILNKEKERLEDKKVEQRIEIEELEQKVELIVDEIKRVEEPQKEEVVPKKEKKRKPPKPKVVDEPLQVYNAGLVLLWPYFSRLFSVLKYTNGKEFVSVEMQYKAIHILQYLATGKTQAPENELVLNKILCDFPITDPVPFGVEFDPNELKMAEGLLQGAINNWPKMKTMVPNSLRGSFLIREGIIKEEEDRWDLTVTKKPYDVLLSSIPWGYTFIKLPWLTKVVSVEWKLF